jgi:hypothetical protein
LNGISAEPCGKHGLRWCGDCAPPPAVPVARQGGGVLPGLDFAGLYAKVAEDEQYGPWITASYPGACRGCGERWDDGDLIRFSEDESGWVSTCCAPAE